MSPPRVKNAILKSTARISAKKVVSEGIEDIHKVFVFQ
jgi:hypothetical protein